MVQTTPPTLNLKEVGEAIAQLQDFRLIMYVLIVVLVIVVTERGFSAWGMRQERKQLAEERKEMWKVADKFTEAAKGVGDTVDKLVIELQVLRALTSRVEQRPGHGD